MKAKSIKGKSTDTEMPEADAVLVFSCAGRIVSLGPLMSKELEGIKDV